MPDRPVMLHQVHRLHTSGDVLCALDGIRALPEYDHRLYVKLGRGVDPRLPETVAGLNTALYLGTTVQTADLGPGVAAVLYHCIGYDEALPEDYIAPPSSAYQGTRAAWIHTPGLCGPPGPRPRYDFLKGRGVTRIAYNSTFTRDHTSELNGMGTDAAPVIPPTVAGDGFRAVQRGDTTFRIGRWSRGDDRKYADDFLLLAGTLTAILPELEIECMGIPRKFRGTPLPPGVRFYENHAVPLETFLGRLDVLLFKTDARTWYEGWCRTVTEAMAAGVIPVVERRGGVTDQVIDGETGYLCDTNAQFIEACLTLGNDPALRARMSAAARALAQQQFTLVRLRRGLIELLALPLSA